jgi:hypothetical protein
MDTPPGIQSVLYVGRFIRDLTAYKPKKLYWQGGASNWEGALGELAHQMFGTEDAEPYRVRINQAACELLKAGRLKEWRRLNRLRDELQALRLEYEFVAAPIKGLSEQVIPKFVQLSLFEDAA